VPFQEEIDPNYGVCQPRNRDFFPLLQIEPKSLLRQLKSTLLPSIELLFEQEFAPSLLGLIRHVDPEEDVSE